MNGGHNLNKKNKNLWEKFKIPAFKQKESICPDSNALAAYLEGKVSKRKIQAIEEHLALCPTCLNALIELRSLLQEKLASPPEEVLMRAKNLVATPIAPKQRFVIRLPDWLTSPYPVASRAFNFTAVAAILIIACFAGLKFGEDTFANQRRISSAYLSEMTFGLADNSDSLFDLDYQK